MAFGLNKKSGLKLLGAAGAMLLAAACSTSGPDVVAAGPDTSNAGNRVIPGSQEDLEQSAGHRVFYGYDKYSLTAQAQATLARQADWLKANPSVNVLIAGNCDERGTREYNLALGARRAQSARSFLISNGVDGNRIRTVSYGKERPLDPRSTSDAWSLNRNATTTIVAAGV